MPADENVSVVKKRAYLALHALYSLRLLFVEEGLVAKRSSIGQM